MDILTLAIEYYRLEKMLRLENMRPSKNGCPTTVSYTHLTLPTIYSV